MTNLFDMICPRCGCDDRIDIQATVWVRVTANGTDGDKSSDGDQAFGPESAAKCCACDFFGFVSEFEPDDARSEGA